MHTFFQKALFVFYIAFFLVFFSTGVFAATAVDAYLEIEGSSIGGAHVTSGGGSWSIGSGSMSVTTTNATALRGSVSVDGVTYSGASTNALLMNDDAHSQEIDFTASAYHPIITFGGFMNIGSYKSGGLWDIFYVDNTSGYPWIVAPQISTQASGCTSGNPSITCVQIEGARSGGTVHDNSQIQITPGKTYWFSTKVDFGSGSVSIAIFDPANNYAPVGTTKTVAIDSPANTTKLRLRMGRQDTHTNNPTSGTYSYMDNIIIDWTNHVFPLIPAAGGGTSYNITASAGSNGTISPSGTIAVPSGNSQGFVITPNSGYQVNQVLVDGSAVGTIPATGGTYTFTNVIAAHTISASFSAIPDTNAPIVTAFTIPTTSSSLSVSVSAFTATDNVSVTGYMVNESSTKPLSTAAGWSASTPTSYTFSSEGAKTLYAWAKDAAGNVSNSLSDTVTVTLPAQGSTIGGIPVENAPVELWAKAGVPGGIPDRASICNTLGVAGQSSTYVQNVTGAQILNAVNGCADTNKAVYLNQGTYNISPIEFGYPGPSFVTLRGAGMGKTILNISAGAYAIHVGSYPPWDGFSWGNAQNITAGGTQGSDTITIASATNYSVGDTCVVDMTNADWIQGYGTGGGTTETYNGDSAGKGRDGTRVQFHLCRVTGKSGNTLTIDPALPFDLNSLRAPQISKSSSRSGPISFGIEDLTVSTTGSTTHGIRINGSYSSWLKNVELKGWGYFGVYLRWNNHFEMRGCYVHDPNNYAVDRGYGLLLDPATNSLIIDNIIYNTQSTILIQGGSTLNVLAYNVFAFGKYVNGGYTGEWLQHEISGNHTPFPAFNLFESNYTGKFQSDYYYGPSGWGVLFRNRIPGNSSATTQNRYAVGIDAFQRNYSVVGNQLGERIAPNSITLALPGVTRTYTQPGTINWGYDPGSSSFSTPYIYRLGYPYSGNNGSSSGTAVHDNNVKTRTLRHGNWDAYNNAVIWDATISDHNIPDSLFLTSKPSFFGSLVWPAYGPSAPTSTITDLNKIPAGYRLLNNNTNYLTGGDNVPPTVSITAPADGATVSANVTISANATDAASAIGGVQFKVDGSNVGAEDTISPYSISWDSTTVSNGTHSITATARDTAGNSATSSGVNVTVNNADTVPPTINSGSPSGTLAYNTTSTTLSVATTENATCKYGTTAGVAYASIANTFTTTGGMTHSATVSGLANGSSYIYYVRCQDTSANLNKNTSDYTITFSVSSTAIDPNLIGWWKFDETSGTTASDSSGNNNNGTLQGAPTFTAGKIGNAITLNGTNQYVSIGDIDANPVSVSLWMKVNSFPVAWASLVMKANTYGFEFNTTNLNFGTGNGTAWGGTEPTVDSGFTAGQWYHIVGVYDGANITYYRNGSQVGSTYSMTMANSNAPLLIGSWNGSIEFFNGTIDDVRVYNKVLAPSEVSVLYNLGNTTPISYHPADTNSDLKVTFSEYLAYANCWRTPSTCTNWNGTGSGVTLSQYLNAASIWKYAGQNYHYISGTTCPPSTPSTCWVAGS